MHKPIILGFKRRTAKWAGQPPFQPRQTNKPPLVARQMVIHPRWLRLPVEAAVRAREIVEISDAPV